MPEYNAKAEAIINADVNIVFNAILDANNFRRWMPDAEMHIMGEEKILQKGSEARVLFGTLNWTEKVVDIVTNKSIQIEYLEGDLQGKYEYTFEPIDGKTKLKINLKVKPTTFLLKIISFLMPKTASKLHSGTLLRGFKGLNEYLIKKGE